MLIETREDQTGHQEKQLHHEVKHTVDEAAHRKCAGFILRGFQHLSGESLECSGQSCVCFELQPRLKSSSRALNNLMVYPTLYLFVLPKTTSPSDSVRYLPNLVRCLEYCRAPEIAL